MRSETELRAALDEMVAQAPAGDRVVTDLDVRRRARTSGRLRRRCHRDLF